jgi:hypothetical protein
LNQRKYHYPHRNLLVIGQQKSGSTWLERMLCDVPGYLRWTPDNIKFQRADLRLGDFVPPPAGYTVTKVHTPPTPANLAVVDATGRPYVVLMRDLRDICVSWSYYLHNEPDHPRYEPARHFSIPETIDYFIRHRLEDYVAWQLDWLRHLEGRSGLLVTYEQLLADPLETMNVVLTHFRLELAFDHLRRIVDEHGFERITGRRRGEADPASFYRKGIAGDWRNHFTETQRRDFEAVAGRALAALGYITGAA